MRCCRLTRMVSGRSPRALSQRAQSSTSFQLGGVCLRLYLMPMEHRGGSLDPMTIRSESFGPAPRSEGQPGGHRFKSCPRYHIRNPGQVNLAGIFRTPDWQQRPRLQPQHLSRCEHILQRPSHLTPKFPSSHRRPNPQRYRQVTVLETTPEHGRLHGDPYRLVERVPVEHTCSPCSLEFLSHDSMVTADGVSCN